MQEGARRIFLEFDAIQSEPEVENIFLATGGSISAAASRGTTDFALTGSEVSTVAELSDTYASTVRVELSANHFSFDDSDPMVVQVSNRIKLLACTSRSGAAINGSIVSTVSGQATAFLSRLLRTGSSSAAVPLTYASWSAHSAVLTLSNFKLVDERDRHYSLRFVKNEQNDTILKTAETFMSEWAEGAWQMRQNTLVYPYSPGLTKCVAKVPAGINESGYSFVHDVAQPVLGEFSYQTVDGLLKAGINIDLEFFESDIEAFMQDTKEPGLKAAQKGGRTLAAAFSLVASFLVSYRADGRTSVMPTGSVAVAAESWLRQAPRHRGKEGNDCDGSAILINNLAQAITSSTPEARAQFPFLNAAYNVLVPHYTVGVSVLGASSAEASGGGSQKVEGETKKHVAGHAVTLMMPSMAVLLSLERGSKQTVSGAPVVETERQAPIAEARFKAMYNQDAVDAMPDAERTLFANWDSAKQALESGQSLVEPFACEGTTPASPIMYRDGEAAVSARATRINDEKSFEVVGATIGRSIKMLHAGGQEGEDLHHMFYSEFCELTFPRNHPLWQDAEVRKLGAACTQLVFSKHDGKTASLPIEACGSTPKELVQYRFATVPLVVAETDTAGVLDFASAVSDADVMPPRPQQTLSAFDSSQLTASLEHLSKLNDTFKARMSKFETEDKSPEGNPVAYLLAFSTLVNNPMSVKHLCERIEKVSVAGVVDSIEVPGLMQNYNGTEAGRMVIVNAVV